MSEPNEQSIRDRDTRLLQRVSHGDADALKELFEHYGRFAYAVAWRVIEDHGAAEDVVQEAFVAVWNRAATFDTSRGSNVRAWILAIVNNRAIDFVRAQRPAHKSPSSIDDVAYVLSADDDFAEVEAADLRLQVRSALEQLPANQREAVELNVLEGFSHREIAEQTDLPLGTIKSRVRLGLRSLYDSLKNSIEEDAR